MDGRTFVGGIDVLRHGLLTRASRWRAAMVVVAMVCGGVPLAARAATVQYTSAFDFAHTGSVSTGLVSVGGAFSQTTVSSSPTLALPLFDPALGRLTGVSVTVATTTATFAVSPSGLLSLVSSASATRTLDYTLTAGTVTGNGPNAVTTSGAALVTLLGTGNAEIGGAPLAATRPYSLASDLAQFTGAMPGTFTVKVNATDALSVTAGVSALNGAGFNGSGRYAGSVGVTYTYTPARTVSGVVYSDADHNGVLGGTESGTGRTTYVKLATFASNACQAPALQAVAANPATGAYSLGLVDFGSYCLIVDDNATLSDVTPSLPTGFVATQPTSGIRQLTVGSALVDAQNFGLYNGSSLSGRLFVDDGRGGGTANDAVANGGEPGRAGAVVTVSAGGTAVGSGTTDGSGNYTLWIPAATTGTLTVQPAAAGVATGGSAGTTGGTYVRTTNTTSFTSAAGQVNTGVDFASVPVNTLVPDGLQTVAPGSVATFAHVFTAGSAGLVTFTTSAVPAAPATFVEALVRDTNCNGSVDAGEPVLAGPVAVATGDVVCLVVRESVAAGAPLGRQNVVTLAATMSYNGANPALTTTVSRTDTTTVGTSNGLRLTKRVRNVTQATAFSLGNSAAPDDVLEYELTAANASAAPVTAIVVDDFTPSYTAFVAAACPGTLPTGVTSCSIATPAVGAQGALQWTFAGALASGGQAVVTYRVRVDH